MHFFCVLVGFTWLPLGKDGAMFCGNCGKVVRPPGSRSTDGPTKPETGGAR